jgi:hypothetical protein
VRTPDEMDASEQEEHHAEEHLPATLRGGRGSRESRPSGNALLPGRTEPTTQTTPSVSVPLLAIAACAGYAAYPQVFFRVAYQYNAACSFTKYPHEKIGDSTGSSSIARSGLRTGTRRRRVQPRPGNVPSSS